MNDKESNELEFNKKNREDYEQLMKDSSVNKDIYWDSHNPIVRIVLLVLGLIIIVGIVYYLTLYFHS